MIVVMMMMTMTTMARYQGVISPGLMHIDYTENITYTSHVGLRHDERPLHVDGH